MKPIVTPLDRWRGLLVKREDLQLLQTIKSRPAMNMIQKAIARGDLRQGMTLVEGTSGNTGAALALLASARGYAVQLFVPETISEHKREKLEALGARLTLTDDIIQAAAAEAVKPGIWRPDQHSNPDNPDSHRLSTGPELLRQLRRRGIEPARTTVFCGLGTGGTYLGLCPFTGGA